MPPTDNSDKNGHLRLFNEHMGLFRKQKLEAAGEMHLKGSKFHKSKKYYAELRGSTIVVFRNAKCAQASILDTKSLVAVIVVARYDAVVIRKDTGLPRIYITHDPIPADEKLMYIRVTGGESELESWRHGLAKAKFIPLPTLSSLTVDSVIGRGGGGKVFMVRWKYNNTIYALKGIPKENAFKSEKSFRHATSERWLMEYVTPHPFLLQMQFAFQTESNLFIATQFCGGGDLASYLRAKGDKTMPQEPAELAALCLHDQKRRRIYGRLSEGQTQLLAAELVLGLEHLHKHGIVYRDLKPENVFIDNTGHIKIGDYGLAKKLGGQEGHHESKTKSVCGTRNYLPPEMLLGRLYSYEADLWTLGITLYRILCGAFPFDAPRSKELFCKVKANEPLLPSWLSKNSCNVLRGLLQKNPERRLNIKELKREPFFASIDWQEVYDLHAGPSIPDVDTGAKAIDALENFELSKLQGITLGEFIEEGIEVPEKMAEQPALKPTHLQDVSRIMIGFEYAYADEGLGTPPPLEVRQQSGGLFSRLSSADDSSRRSPRVLSDLISQKSFGLMSPRGVRGTASSPSTEQRAGQGMEGGRRATDGGSSQASDAPTNRSKVRMMASILAGTTARGSP